MAVHSRYGQEAMEREAVRKHAWRTGALSGFLTVVGGWTLLGFIGIEAFANGMIPVMGIGAIVMLAVAISIKLSWKRERAGL